MGEATDLEPIAIAMYESFCRAEANRSLTSSADLRLFIWTKYPDWVSLDKETREHWREKAREMIREAR